jgi:hypothetical protein
MWLSQQGFFCSRALVDDIQLCDDEQWKVDLTAGTYFVASKVIVIRDPTDGKSPSENPVVAPSTT